MGLGSILGGIGHGLSNAGHNLTSDQGWSQIGHGLKEPFQHPGQRFGEMMHDPVQGGIAKGAMVVGGTGLALAGGAAFAGAVGAGGAAEAGGASAFRLLPSAASRLGGGAAAEGGAGAGGAASIGGRLLGGGGWGKTIQRSLAVHGGMDMLGGGGGQQQGPNASQMTQGNVANVAAYLNPSQFG